jgi:hypothetical protein
MRRTGCNEGEAVTLRQETDRGTGEAYRGKGPSTHARIAEITSGSCATSAERRVYIEPETVCNCTKDEGRPFEAVLQGKASNHLKLLWSKAMVVSVGEKVPQDGIRCGPRR